MAKALSQQQRDIQSEALLPKISGLLFAMPLAADDASRLNLTRVFLTNTSNEKYRLDTKLLAAYAQPENVANKLEHQPLFMSFTAGWHLFPVRNSGLEEDFYQYGDGNGMVCALLRSTALLKASLPLWNVFWTHGCQRRKTVDGLWALLFHPSCAPSITLCMMQARINPGWNKPHLLNCGFALR